MDPVEADRLVAEARPAAERLGDPAVLAGFWIADGLCAGLFTGEPAAAISSYIAARRQAEQIGDRGLQAFTWVGTSAAHAYAGPLPDGLACSQTCIALCGDDPFTGTGEVGYSVHDVEHTAARVAVDPERPARRGRPGAADRAHSVRAAADGRMARVDAHPFRALRGPHRGSDTARRGSAGAPTTRYGWPRTPAMSPAPSRRGTRKPSQRCSPATRTRPRPRCPTHWRGAASSDLLSWTRPSCSPTWRRAHVALGDRPAAHAAADEAVEVAARQRAQVIECRAHLFRPWCTGRPRPPIQILSKLEPRSRPVRRWRRGWAPRPTPHSWPRNALASSGGDLGAVAKGYDSIGATGHARRLREELDRDGVGG